MTPRPDASDRPARLRWTRTGAFLSLLLERLWPVVFALSCLLAVFLTLAWSGLFAATPFPGRIAILVLLVAAALVALWRARGLRWPNRAAVEQRIERASALQHQPLQTQGERPAITDPFAAALWREHQRRMAERLQGLTGGLPAPRTERLDPHGLRAILALALVVAFGYSFGSGGGRVADAFRPDDGRLAPGARLDAWVTPPSYTGKAPIFLTGANGDDLGGVTVPEGSVLSVRLSDGTGATLSFQPAGGGAAVTIEPGSEAAKSDNPASTAPAKPAPVGSDGVAATTSASATAVAKADGESKTDDSGPRQYDVPLRASGSAVLATAFSTLGNWRFDVTPDNDPSIAFDGDPKIARNGALELAYRVTDDYGVRQGRAEITVTDPLVAAGARPLVEKPEINLALPRRTKGEAKGRTSVDLTESPYAGASVAMTLVAVDDAGQSGRSEPLTLMLPQRPFSNPLAKAVVEQRRILALDAQAAPRVVEMLDAVTLHGEDFIPEAGAYLALKAVRTRIATAHDDDALRSAVDFLWQIALGIEDGNLSIAEKKLRDAREQLSEALENGASDEEIDRLMQELRQAMQEYLQAMAEAMKNMPPMSQQQMQAGEMQEIRPQDLDKMLDQIEDLAKSGSKGAAQQLLSELQQMMDNLQTAQPGQQQQGGENPMQQQMDKLGEMLQRQQQLMDKTFDLGRRQMESQDGMEDGAPQDGTEGEPQQGQEGQQGQQGQQSGQGQQPMTAEELQKALDQLAQQQGQLQKDLEALQQQMQGMGMQPSEGLGKAGKSMGEAQQSLGQGDDGSAVGQQGQALQALRDGARDAMKQMQQAMQQGQGQQGQGRQGQMGQGFGPGQQRSGRDPLGRQRATQGPDFGQDVGVPDEIDTQRARRILDAIRNRLGDALSPELERQYLERLLKTP
ncbi:TIGR02302 family protein [Mangrovicella endophytica]|uniref:TIGR02302 family protein n=1 Tax=Mangrovicella endophytica TaxID=2066697 RepID=UPI000C9DC54A|nr:TIGR02302 family protein [Mangrovicella endophytica]